MDYLASVVPCLWSCISPRLARLAELNSKVEHLELENRKLNDRHEDITRRVEQEEFQPDTYRLKEVEGWLKGASQLTMEASRIVEKGNKDIQSRCLWGKCPRNCLSSYEITGQVEEMLVKVREALENGRFETVTFLSSSSVQERPLEKIVGSDAIFEEAWKWLVDENTRVLGLYGIGGVGKTTLLSMINNKLLDQRDGSKLVIWVIVKKGGTVKDVQQAIAKGVREAIPNWQPLKVENWDPKETDEKACVIHKILKKKQSVLLIDDLWEGLDLLQIGIPSTVKIVFTTRSLEICRQMEAQKRIEITCLGSSEAKALFNAKVGEETLNSHPEIPGLAEDVARKCGGLPIALKTIGRAMSGKTSPKEWRRAIRLLSKSRSKITSMESDVFPSLKLSYDSLGNETIKQCFLYCALFPESFRVPYEVLIKCWIAEGLIHIESKKCNDNRDEEDSTSEESEDEGLEIIQSLKNACLLEEGDLNPVSVKMHDVIHDMALWIARTEGKNWDKSRVDQEVNNIWEKERISVEKWMRAAVVLNNSRGFKYTLQLQEITTQEKERRRLEVLRTVLDSSLRFKCAS